MNKSSLKENSTDYLAMEWRLGIWVGLTTRGMTSEGSSQDILIIWFITISHENSWGLAASGRSNAISSGFSGNREKLWLKQITREAEMGRFYLEITEWSSRNVKKQPVFHLGIFNCFINIHSYLNTISFALFIKDIQRILDEKFSKSYPAHLIRKVMMQDVGLSYKKISLRTLEYFSDIIK